MKARWESYKRKVQAKKKREEEKENHTRHPLVFVLIHRGVEKVFGHALTKAY